MKRSTGDSSLGLIARGIPLTTSTSTSSAHVRGEETMRDQPSGPHPFLSSSSPEDHADLRAGGKGSGKRGSGIKEGGGGGSRTKARGLERGGALEPEPTSVQRPHWCLQSLHTSSEPFANGEASLHFEDQTSNARRPRQDLSRIYFPWTLSASGSRLPAATSVVDAGGQIVRHINTAQDQQRSRPGGHRCGRSGSGLSSPSSASNSSFDRIRPSSAHDDSRPGSHQKVLLSSPFESTLTQLRLDRLRIEEEHLLEIKRQEELERIRGPQPKWYALKSSQFGRELKRHNDLLKIRDGGQDQVDYRNTLERASQHFQQAYYAESQ